MNNELILKSDILDILFEKRNKAYGAYVLRKSYEGRVKKALGIMMCVAIALIGLAFIKESHPLISDTIICEIVEPELGKIETKKEEIKKPEKTTVEAPKKKDLVLRSEQMYINNLKIVRNTETEDSIRFLDEKMPIGNTNTNSPFAPPATVNPVSTEPVAGGVEVKPNRGEPVESTEVEVMPSFPGGTEALLNFLRRHLDNPEPMNSGESVTVKARFVVGYDGKLQGFRIIQDGGDVFNKEVMRVLKKMPDWVPGKAKGENVSVYYTIPVKFTGED